MLLLSSRRLTHADLFHYFLYNINSVLVPVTTICRGLGKDGFGQIDSNFAGMPISWLGPTRREDRKYHASTLTFAIWIQVAARMPLCFAQLDTSTILLRVLQVVSFHAGFAFLSDESFVVPAPPLRPAGTINLLNSALPARYCNTHAPESRFLECEF
jgi:hypothetical protein